MKKLRAASSGDQDPDVDVAVEMTPSKGDHDRLEALELLQALDIGLGRVHIRPAGS